MKPCRQTTVPEEEALSALPGRTPAKERVKAGRRVDIRLKGQWSQKLLEKKRLLKRDRGSLSTKLVINRNK